MLRIKIVIEADGREAEFARLVPHPPVALCDTLRRRHQAVGAELVPHLIELSSEARNWLETGRPLADEGSGDG